MMADGGMWFGGGFMFIFWIFLFAVLVWSVVALFRAGSSAGNASGTDKEEPLDILKRRFANGEINEQEFESRSKKLSS